MNISSNQNLVHQNEIQPIINIDTILDNFPFANYREGQREAIVNIANTFANGTKFIILEGPCGSGKSAIGYTIAKAFESSFWICPQKILQDQITNDFGKDLEVTDLKGRNAYPCTYWQNFNNFREEDQKKALQELQQNKNAKWSKNKSMQCDTGVCRLRDKKSKCQECLPNSLAPLCPYWDQVKHAQLSKVCILNFKSFLYQVPITRKFNKRTFLIIDEVHNLESELLDFVSLSLSDHSFLKYKINFKKFETIKEYKEYFEEIEIISLTERLINEAKRTNNTREEDDLKDLLSKIYIFLECADDDSWIHEFKTNGPIKTISLKPLFIDDFALKYVFQFCDYVLMMSATILDPKMICDSLGIKTEEVFSYKMVNRFPVKNRPIFFTPCGSMNYNDKLNTIPKMIKKVDEICNHYLEHKGIIHSHNFEIAEILHQNCKNRHRFLYQKEWESKNIMLEEHNNRSDSIIIAPAMHEGLDLKNDLARFQIITKVPYPSFVENKQLRYRMELDNNYYQWLTSLKLSQSIGRAVRTNEDWAHTFILDAEFQRFYKRSKKFIPSWIKEAIKWQ